MTSRKPLVLINGVPTALPAGDTIPFQPVNTLLTEVAALAPSADQLAYFTGASTVALSTITSLGRSLIAGSTQAAMLTTLGAAPLAAPAFTGLPTAPTATQGTNTTQLATTAYVVAQVSNDAVLKVGGSTIGDGTAGNSTFITFYKNGAYASISSAANAGGYATGAITGAIVFRNTGDGTTPKPIIIAASEVHLGASAVTTGNFPTVLKVTPTEVTTTVRPTFAGNLAWDAGNLTPAAIGAMVDGTGSIGVQTFDAEYLLNGVSLSAARNSGMYRYGDTCTDKPSTTNGFMIQMTRASNVIYQMAVDDNLEMFNRVCMSGVWGSWIQLANQADLINNTVVTTANKPTAVSNAWIEEVENTGEGYLGVGGGISNITTMYATQRMLYCLDSAGVKYGVALERIG